MAARGPAHEVVAGAAVREGRRGDLDHLGPVPPGRGHRAVARARVADQQFDLGVDLLGARGCEHLIEQRASVAHRDRDGHDVSHGYERRRRPRIESRNDEKKTCRPTMISVAARIARRSSDSSPKPRSIQMPTMTPPTTRPAQRDHAAEQQAVLEPEAGAHAVEPRVALAHEVRAVGVRAQAERDAPGCRRSSAAQPAIIVCRSHARPKTSTAQTTISGDERAQHGHHRAGDDEQVRRAVDEQEAQVAPAVAEARELATRRRAGGTRSGTRGCRASPWRRGSPSRRRTPSRSCAGRARAGRRGGTPRMPQWASLTPVRKKRLRMPVRTGLPT